MIPFSSMSRLSFRVRRGTYLACLLRWLSKRARPHFCPQTKADLNFYICSYIEGLPSDMLTNFAREERGRMLMGTLSLRVTLQDLRKFHGG